MKSDLGILNTKKQKNERTKEQKKSLFRFHRFPVYKDARDFRKELKRLIKEKFPKEEKFCLSSQLYRALDSILLNIAEGSERYSDIDFSRFLNMSLTSVNEVMACLDASLDDEYISKEEYRYYMNKIENIYKQLKAFSSKVRKDSIRN